VRVGGNDPAGLSLLGMIHLRVAVAAARHQDRRTATWLSRSSEVFVMAQRGRVVR
jgi:hypothetical protein